MTKEDLLHQIDDSTDAVLDKLSVFTNYNFNKALISGKWSAAQIADHILKIDGVVISALSGLCSGTTRDPFAKVAMIKEHLYDFDKEFVAPEIVVPSTDTLSKDTLIEEILRERKMIRNLIMVSDITETCMDSKHQGFGQLTRGEWIFFDVCHTNRHAKQLEKLAALA